MVPMFNKQPVHLQKLKTLKVWKQAFLRSDLASGSDIEILALGHRILGVFDHCRTAGLPGLVPWMFRESPSSKCRFWRYHWNFWTGIFEGPGPVLKKT